MSVLSLDDAKVHLNMTGSSQYDGEIQATIDAAEAAIAQRVGPLEPTTITSRVTANGGQLVLPVYPVVSLTSITPQGLTALDLTNVVVDDGGVVSYTASGSTFATSAHTVVYQAGRDECPEDLVYAVKELVKHLFSSQRGPTQRPGSGAGDSYSNTVPGAAYAFPFRVEQLLAPHTQFGIA